jgi:hypothetical protein
MKPVWNDLYRYVRPAFLIYFFLNFMALLLYFVLVAGIAQQARSEQRDYYDASDSFAYLGTAGPVLAVCLLINALWGIKALTDIFRRKGFYALVAGVFVAGLWAAIYCFCTLITRAAILNGTNHYP